MSGLRAKLCLLTVLLSWAVPLPAAEEAAIKVTSPAGKSVSITATDLKVLPRTDVETKDREGKTIRYSGVEITHLVKKVGVAQGEELRGEWMRAFVEISASDGYRAVFALPEFDPAFTDRKIIIADTRDDAALDERSGPFQIIIPGEKRHARWVRMVTEIKVIDSHGLNDAKEE